MMKARKMHRCMPKFYAIRKYSTSDVTTVFTTMTKYKYQKYMGKKKKKYASTKAWYLKYQAYMTINKNCKRVIEADMHEIPIVRN